ncbi:septum formation initiator family protein [Nesterenkonia sp. E16_7]|uniref:FtsB family cell division protein n=1 Tax=unclassified Nesterenkonia TaxID=2629769 RepID=UPI001A91A9CD|nr:MULTISPECIES: septum formation initiator family protein [unclassified Nesterenkonia]MBO0596436.1 septum formation initiator family protein [Nesterenkonia sp. E16_10]MBO0597336.1 septum formation initiator family protein [Nesterenkonia sp. E16_7]
MPNRRASSAEAKARAAQARRLAEREQVSGEIRTPADITARRKTRSTASAGSVKTPVSAATTVPERTFPGRMILLSIVVLVVISFLVPTVNSFFQQRSELNELESQIAAEQQEQAELQSELVRWDDPDFVRQQARERINLVMPGERRYQVMGEPGASTEDIEQLDSTEVRHDLPWAEALWDSLVRSAAED